MNILIVGGGVGGLALAIQTAKAGMSVLIVEADPDWRAVGAGLTLNGMTLNAFLQLGVLDRIREHAHLHGGRRIYGPDWEVLSDQPAFVPEDGDLNAGGGVLRPVLHEILRDAALAAGATARLGVTVTRIEQDEGGVRAMFSDGSDGRFDLLAGADGVRSSVRALCFPDAPQPRFTGEGCWRAVFPRPAEVTKPWSVLGRTYKAGLRPISEHEMYLHLVEHVPDNPWRPESDWPQLLSERLATFGGMIGELGSTLTNGAQVNYRPLEANMLPLPWHKGRVVLLGDAAHATTPHAAYGAGLAVEDALVLAEVLGFDLPLEERLLRYEALRYDRCREVVERALRVGEVEMAKCSHEEWQRSVDELRAAIRRPLPAVV